jgi:hypothetical protein
VLQMQCKCGREADADEPGFVEEARACDSTVQYYQRFALRSADNTQGRVCSTMSSVRIAGNVSKMK